MAGGAKYKIRRCLPPSQTWRTSLNNHIVGRDLNKRASLVLVNRNRTRA